MSDEVKDKSEKEKLYTEKEMKEQIQKAIDSKISLIRNELKAEADKEVETKLAIKRTELEDKIKALNQEVYGSKAKDLFVELNGDIIKYEDFIKANDIDITKPKEELRKQMSEIMEKKYFYRRTNANITYTKPIEIEGEKSRESNEQDILEKAISNYNKINKIT